MASVRQTIRNLKARLKEALVKAARFGGFDGEEKIRHGGADQILYDLEHKLYPGYKIREKLAIVESVVSLLEGWVQQRTQEAKSGRTGAMKRAVEHAAPVAVKAAQETVAVRNGNLPEALRALQEASDRADAANGWNKD